MNYTTMGGPMESGGHRRHDLMTSRTTFAELVQGKPFDIRRDRGFGVGDLYVVQEYDQQRELLTGVLALFRVTWVTPLEGGLVVVGLTPTTIPIPLEAARAETRIEPAAQQAEQEAALVAVAPEPVRTAPPTLEALSRQPFPLADDRGEAESPGEAVVVSVPLPLTADELAVLRRRAGRHSVAAYVRACLSISGTRARDTRERVDPVDLLAIQIGNQMRAGPGRGNVVNPPTFRPPPGRRGFATTPSSV
jgi:hypothetical protein